MPEPKITAEVLDQWEQSARADLTANKPWCAHPEAILTLVAEVRQRRKDMKSAASTLVKISDDVRLAGDMQLKLLGPDGVTDADITLADELWLNAVILDPDRAFHRAEPDGPVTT